MAGSLPEQLGDGDLLIGALDRLGEHGRNGQVLDAGKKLGSPEWLLVCLGNYGREYENTRHNIGFMTAERLIDKRNLRCNRLRFRALTEVIEFGGANVLLMMPQTYMNLSGESVGEAARFYKVPADHVVVISDDVSLAAGQYSIASAV